MTVTRVFRNKISPFNHSSSIRGGKAFCNSSVADGRSDGLGDIKRRSKDDCSGYFATQAGGSAPFCFRSERIACLSIAVENGCHSSKNTTPKLNMSTCRCKT